MVLHHGGLTRRPSRVHHLLPPCSSPCKLMIAPLDSSVTEQAFTPIVTMVALFIAGLETPTRRLITAVVLIASGTAMASYGVRCRPLYKILP